MKKRFLSVVLTLFAFLAPVSGKEKILHSETKYFDIIFDEASRRTAEELHGSADEILEDLCRQYKVEPDFRIPLVITSRTEIFNAYFSNFNNNHIVLFDTAPDENMIEFSRTMKSTFIHELTHLVSNNARNGFWRGMGRAFGDVYNPGYYLTMPTFFKEGASVEEESKNGEGRLNDGFFLHNIRQAKISGKFPGYTDCFGARSIYPNGTASYLFGSAFTEYIINKYGMDKYAEFWHRGTNSNRLTSTAVFKKTYGVSMRKEWKAFYDSIDVDGIEKNPASLNGIKQTDFKNKSLHLYSVIGTKNGKAVVLDETASSVYIGKKKIFTMTGIISARLTGGEKYIAVTALDSNHLDVKVKACLYSLERRRWIHLDGTGVKQLAVMEKDGKEYVAAIRNISQNCILEISEMNKEKRVLCSAAFPFDEMAYSLCDDSNGNLFFLLKKEMNFSLCRATIKDGKIDFQSFNLAGMKPRQLSAATDNVGNTTVLFSYVEGKSFPRLAKAILHEKEIELYRLEENISGGIYTPVQNGNEILYAARFYTEGAVHSIDFESFQSQGKISSETVPGSQWSNNSETASTFSSSDDFSFSEYKKLFAPRQTIVPLSILKSYYISPSVYFNDEEDCLGNPSLYLLGLTVIKSNPWDTRHAAITAGFNPAKKAGGAGLTLVGNTCAGNLVVMNTVNTIFDRDGFMQANNSFKGSIAFKTGKISTITLSEANILVYGKDDMDSKTRDRYYLKDEQLKKNYTYDKNTVSLLFSTMHKTGAKLHEISGLTVGMNLKNIYATVDAKKEDSIFNRMLHYENDKIQFSQIYPSAEISFPGLIPIDCKGPFTYNLPVKAYGSLFQFNDAFLVYLAETVIFSWEIQKGLGPVPLYATTLTLSAFYQEDYATNLNRNMEIRYLSEDFSNMGDMKRNRYAGGTLLMKISGNTGVLASPELSLSAGLKAQHCIQGNRQGETRFYFTTRANFVLF